MGKIKVKKGSIRENKDIINAKNVDAIIMSIPKTKGNKNYLEKMVFKRIEKLNYLDKKRSFII